MRATQMKSAFNLQGNRSVNWMAHTPVGHDKFYFGVSINSLLVGVVSSVTEPPPESVST